MRLISKTRDAKPVPLSDYHEGAFVMVVDDNDRELGPFIVCRNRNPIFLHTQPDNTPPPPQAPASVLVGEGGWGTAKKVVLVCPRNGILWFAEGSKLAYELNDAAIVLGYLEGG